MGQTFRSWHRAGPVAASFDGADPHAGGASTLCGVIAGATGVPVADEVAAHSVGDEPCRAVTVVVAIGASSRSSLCGRGAPAVEAQQRRSARRAGPPLRYRGWVKRRIALEHLAAASALAGTHVLGLLLLGGNHSHDVHRGLPSRPQTKSAQGGCALERDQSYSGKIKLAKVF